MAETPEYVADADYDQEKFTAQAKMNEANRESQLEADRKQQAEDKGVADARFIGYDEVLAAYQNRSDTEALWARRARHYADATEDQDFARHADYRGVTPPNTDSGWDGAWPDEDDEDL